jgi:DNA-binding LacI/PurR family transcriptional regulator
MKVTMRDVADLAGVSTSTVSRVMNGRSAVSPETAQRVQQAVAELGYQPRGNSNSSEPLHLGGRNVVLALLGMHRSLVSLPVVAEAIHGVERAIADAGGNCLLADAPHIDQLPPVLERKDIDGVILKGALQGTQIGRTYTPVMERLRSFPSVWLYGRPRECWGDTVGANDFLVGEIAAHHLIERGHMDLAFINPKGHHILFDPRYQGFVTRARSEGANVSMFCSENRAMWQLPLKIAQDVESVQELVEAMLAQTPRPTAVFAPADSIAALIYRALTVRGLRIGEEISLVSCNNEQPIKEMLYPALTTIDVHATAIGHRAVDQLVWRIKNRDAPAMELRLEPTLIEGESVSQLSCDDCGTECTQSVAIRHIAETSP